MVLNVEAIPGGFTVTDADNEWSWWSVAFHGATPTIASYLCERVDPHSRLGRRILTAVRDSLAAA